jgi:hypothetical protein
MGVKLLAYAVGCNPDTDPFDDWWELCAPNWAATTSASTSTEGRRLHAHPAHRQDDLMLSATATHLSLEVVPRIARQPPLASRSPRTGGFLLRCAGGVDKGKRPDAD